MRSVSMATLGASFYRNYGSEMAKCGLICKEKERLVLFSGKCATDERRLKRIKSEWVN